jgi:hypothetical protein
MALTSISLVPQFGNDSVIAINCGTSTPKLSGSIDISSYPNLTNFTCSNNHITQFTGNTFCNKLISLKLDSNKLTILPVFSGMPSLREMRIEGNLFQGSVTELNALTSLVTVRLQQNRSLGGTLPSLSSLTKLESFYCIACALTGSLPSLSNNTFLEDFRCDSQFSSSKLEGSLPNLSYNTRLQFFYGFNNSFSGNIPDLSNNVTLFEFKMRNNKLTGWTGGTVSNNLGLFDASNNLLTAPAVNSILAAFVAANKPAGSKFLALSGSNAAPTGQGLIDKGILISRGWNVGTS